MTELITFPDADEVLWTFLDTQLQTDADYAGVHAAGLIPKARPSRLVRVRLGGGTEVDVITTQPTVFVESYAAKFEDAKKLAGFCHAQILRAGRDGWFGSIATRGVDVISRPQDLPDPLTDQARFTATYAVMLRGAPA